VVLGAMRPAHDVGIYGAAYQPIEYLVLGSAILVNVLFPLLASWNETDHDRFVSLYRRGTDALAAATLAVPVLAVLVGPPVVDAVLEPRYGPSARVLLLLSVALVFIVAHTWQAFVLLAAGQQRVMLGAMSVALALNIVLDVALISAFGSTGAALATLATSAAVCWWMTGATTRLAGASVDAGSLCRVAAAAMAMAVAGWLALLAGLAWPLVAAAALAVYVVALRRLGVADPVALRSLLAPTPARANATAPDEVYLP
jgi:O-antigen/teichoic acid export membrane protein